MSLALRIASRYLFSKKSHSAINIISVISVCGVALITAALICTLSVYNGFSHLIDSLLCDIQPELKILPSKGKTLDSTLDLWDEIAGWDEVAYITPVIEETALAVYERQMPVIVKGIPLDYNNGIWATTGQIEALGWLAVALVIFTTWKPLNTIWGAYLFGLLYWLYNFLPKLLGATDVERTQSLYQMIPYLVTILVLIIVSMRRKRESQPPASLGLAYFREER